MRPEYGASDPLPGVMRAVWPTACIGTGRRDRVTAVESAVSSGKRVRARAYSRPSPYGRHREATRPAPPPVWMGTEEDDMTSTLTPTCSFCGLRFENRPLLELHVREDHPQRGSPAESRQSNPAGAPASQQAPRSPASGHSQPARTPRASAGTVGTGSPRPRRPHTGRVMTGMHRMIGAFRRANAELRLASEVMLHPAGPPRPRPQSADPPGKPDARHAAIGQRADRDA